MAKRTPECDWSDYSSGLQKEAERVQKGGPFRQWVASHERKENNGSSLPESPPPNPHGYYRGVDEIFKGGEFPDGILPTNVKPFTPTRLQKLRVELRLLRRRLNQKLQIRKK